ncbi:MAG: 3-oxoadipate CoA-transferase subunit A [Syntrophomonadaceae bacterium]|nr:3-oxoadipate CoA-transferase subunit A [Bacillota bacterium]
MFTAPEGKRKSADKTMTLTEAFKLFINNGDSIAFSGMGGSQCVAHTYELIRLGYRGMTLFGDSPCEAGDMLIGAGVVNRIEVAWCAYAVAGLGHNYRRAVEESIPAKIEVKEYSNYTMGLRFLSGAMNLPFLPTKSLLGSDLPTYNPEIKEMECPYTGERLALVPAARPDVAVVHVSRADKRGNCQNLGFISNAENIGRAAKKTIVTCEELVSTDEIRRNANLTFLPEYCVDAVVEVPFASHPWNFPYAYAYDIPFHAQQMEAYRTREGFLNWLDEWCFAAGSWDGYLRKVGWDRLFKLQQVERRFTLSSI